MIWTFFYLTAGNTALALDDLVTSLEEFRCADKSHILQKFIKPPKNGEKNRTELCKLGRSRWEGPSRAKGQPCGFQDQVRLIPSKVSFDMIDLVT